jgi:hypothetical protein
MTKAGNTFPVKISDKGFTSGKIKINGDAPRMG